MNLLIGWVTLSKEKVATPQRVLQPMMAMQAAKFQPRASHDSWVLVSRIPKVGE